MTRAESGAPCLFLPCAGQGRRAAAARVVRPPRPRRRGPCSRPRLGTSAPSERRHDLTVTNDAAIVTNDAATATSDAVTVTNDAVTVTNDAATTGATVTSDGRRSGAGSARAARGAARGGTSSRVLLRLVPETGHGPATHRASRLSYGVTVLTPGGRRAAVTRTAAPSRQGDAVTVTARSRTVTVTVALRRPLALTDTSLPRHARGTLSSLKLTFDKRGRRCFAATATAPHEMDQPGSDQSTMMLRLLGLINPPGTPPPTPGHGPAFL